MSDGEVTIDLSEAGDTDPEGDRPLPDPEQYEEFDEDLRKQVDTDEQAEALAEAAQIARPRQPIPAHAVQYLRKHRVLKASEMSELEDPDWFIEDLIPAAPRTMIQGQGGSYKSFLVLDWMLCAATHRSWHGRHIAPGRCLYIAGEGAVGLRKRINAWLANNNCTWADLENRIDFVAEPLQFFSISGDTEKAVWQRDAWRALIRNGQVRYLVVDTLHTMSSGADENSNSDMGKVLETATYIAGGTGGAQTFFVHHKGKTGSFGGRGASSLRDDFDVTIDLITKDAKGQPLGELLAQMHPDKIRDAEPFQPLNIQLGRYAEEDSRRKSLFIETVATAAESAKQAKAGPPKSAVEKAVEAITEHELLREGWGEGRVYDALKALDLGYNFGHYTVGKALKQLRETQVALETMRRSASGSDT